MSYETKPGKVRPSAPARVGEFGRALSTSSLLMKRYIDAPQDGQVNLTAALLLVAVIVTGVWVWKRLPLATQGYLIDQAIPLALLVGMIATGGWFVIRYIRTRRMRRQERMRLVRSFTQASTVEKRLDIAFALIEVNHYHREGLEDIEPALRDLFATPSRARSGTSSTRFEACRQAIWEWSAIKRRCIAAEALEDDHAYVRACAALGLGRLRASEAKERLKVVSVEDWDQTVRSRAREAMERIP